MNTSGQSAHDLGFALSQTGRFNAKTGRRWAHTVAHLVYTRGFSILLCAAGIAFAQVGVIGPKPQTPAEQAVPEDPLGRSTPQGSVMGFLRAAQREDYSLAARYLEGGDSAKRSQELAKQLQTIVNFTTSVNPSRLSRAQEGDLQDGLSPDLEQIGVLEIGSTRLEIKLRLVRQGEQPPVWLFSSETLRGVPQAFQQVGATDYRQHLPRFLLEKKFLSFPLWQWIGMFVGLALAFGLASLATRLLTRLLRPLIRRQTGLQEVGNMLSMVAPLRVLLLAIAISAFSEYWLSALVRRRGERVAAILAIFGSAWLVIRLADIVAEWGTRRLHRTSRLGGLALIGLLRRLLKATALAASALALLSLIGVDLTAILAGLGLGGVAIAFAAQKTIENLFGGVSLITDEPIRVGDFCRVADQMGTVEDIGLRSTRIRTLDRTAVSIPNGQLASAVVENYTMRDSFWFHPRIGLRLETTAEQLRNALASITAMLLSHPKVAPEDARVRFVGLGNSSLDIEIFSYVKERELPPFLLVQEDLLLRIMEILEANGIRIAFPSQTVYWAEDTWPGAAGSRHVPGQMGGSGPSGG